MSQPEEVEGLRCTGFALFLPLSGGKPPEPKKPGFVRMQLQTELRESFAKVPKEPLCIVGTLEAEHEVVGVSHNDDVTERTPPSPLLHPKIKRIMQTDVGQQRRYRRPLWRAHIRGHAFALFHDPRFQPFLDEPQDPLIRNAMLDKLDQPAVVDGIEEPTDVRIKHPVHLLARNSDRQRVKRVMRSTSWPETV